MIRQDDTGVIEGLDGYTKTWGGSRISTEEPVQ